MEGEQYTAMTFQYTPIGWNEETVNISTVEKNLDQLKEAVAEARV
jgi:hypothetical protein